MLDVSGDEFLARMGQPVPDAAREAGRLAVVEMAGGELTGWEVMEVVDRFVDALEADRPDRILGNAAKRGPLDYTGAYRLAATILAHVPDPKSTNEGSTMSAPAAPPPPAPAAPPPAATSPGEGAERTLEDAGLGAVEQPASTDGADKRVAYVILYRRHDVTYTDPWVLLVDVPEPEGDPAGPQAQAPATPRVFRTQSGPADARKQAARTPELAEVLRHGADLVAIPARSWHEKLGAGYKPRDPELDV